MSPLPNYDIHSHTVYCGHAEPDATVANMADRAHALGLSTYGFSEHCMSQDHVAWLTAIRAEVADLAPCETRYIVGVELDPDPATADGSFRTYPDVDYIIMAIHFLPDGRGHWQFDRKNAPQSERLDLGNRWLNWYAATVDRGGFEILAHPFREPMTLGLFDIRDQATINRVTAILEHAKDQSMAFELNNGWLEGVQTTGQADAFLALAKQMKAMGMRFSRGSDAHAVEHVGGCNAITSFAEALDLRPTDWLQVDDLLGLHAHNAARLCTPTEESV